LAILIAFLFTSFTIGVVSSTFGFDFPDTNQKFLLILTLYASPISFLPTFMAPNGQIYQQTPQPLHKSWMNFGYPPGIQKIAFERHFSAHIPHFQHFLLSSFGIG